MVVDGVPRLVVLGGAVILGTLLWLVAVWVGARALYWFWRRVSRRVRWVLGVVFPESPLVQFAAGLMLFVGLTIASIGVLPSLVGDLSESSGPAGVADDLSERGLSSDWEDIVDGDAIGGTSVCRGQRIDAPDRDEDGLPDAWERAGVSQVV